MMKTSFVLFITFFCFILCAQTQSDFLEYSDILNSRVESGGRESVAGYILADTTSETKSVFVVMPDRGLPYAVFIDQSVDSNYSITYRDYAYLVSHKPSPKEDPSTPMELGLAISLDSIFRHEITRPFDPPESQYVYGQTTIHLHQTEYHFLSRTENGLWKARKTFSPENKSQMKHLTEIGKQLVLVAQNEKNSVKELSKMMTLYRLKYR